MPRFTPRMLFIAITMASAVAGAAESGVFLGLEYNKGGTKVYPDPSVVISGSLASTDQRTQVDLREGDSFVTKIGYDWLIGDSAAIRGAVGYGMASDKMNSTKSSHIPLELLLFYRNKGHRIGIGPVLHVERQAESTFNYNKITPADSTTTPATVELKVPYWTKTKGSDSVSPGFKIEYNYEPSWGQGLYFGLQYTYMRYEYDKKQYIWQGYGADGSAGPVVVGYFGAQNASSGGVTMGLRF